MAAGFSLIELLVVMAIMGVVVALAVPALKALGGSRNFDASAHLIAGILEQARSHATASNTYVWVGLFEEDWARPEGAPGIGRIVLLTAASKDGTMIYEPSVNGGIDPAKLVQLGKLVKVENCHLKTAAADDPSFPVGSGTGNTFDARPEVATGGAAQIGDATPPDSVHPLQYPVGGNAAPKYTFNKMLQFNPRGEVSVVSSLAGSGYESRPIVEIGLQQTRGNQVDSNNKNVVAIQITGIVGNVKIYRR